jgi:hypothetical protein
MPHRARIGLARLSLAILLLLSPGSGRTASAQALGGQVAESFDSLTKLITASAYIDGLGFAVGAIIQFKQHKDNPQQTPVGTPIALVAAAAALLFLPSILNVASAAQTGGSGTALSASLSCPVFVGEGTLLGEDRCVWAKAGPEWTEQSGTTAQGSTYRAGGQAEIAPEWFLGGSIGAGNQTMQSYGTSSRSQTFDASLSLKRTAGPWLFAGAAAFTANSTQVSGIPSLQLGDVTANAYGGGLRVRGAYDFAFTGWYVRPRLDLDLVHRRMPGFQVATQGMTVLTVSDFAKTSFVATPTVEVGGRYDIPSTRMILRPYAAIGASFLPDNTSTFNVQFAGPLAFFGGFQPSVIGPSVLANVEAGVQLYRSNSVELKAEYTLTTGYSYLSQAAGLRGAWHF